MMFLSTFLLPAEPELYRHQCIQQERYPLSAQRCDGLLQATADDCTGELLLSLVLVNVVATMNSSASTAGRETCRVAASRA